MDWVEVFAASTEYEIILLQGYLEENGIQCVIMNQHNSMYNFGEYRLMVNRGDMLNAKELISKQQNGK